MLDADQLVSIFTFSILQSKFRELPGHIRMIEEFTSTQVQNGKIGQALFTLKAATDNIGSGNISRKISIIIDKKKHMRDVKTPDSCFKIKFEPNYKLKQIQSQHDNKSEGAVGGTFEQSFIRPNRNPKESFDPFISEMSECKVADHSLESEEE